MKLLVIGNGSIGIDRKTGGFYITKSAGFFLNNLQQKADVHYLDLGSIYNQNNSQLDFDLKSRNIPFGVFGNKKNPLAYLKLIRLILKMDYVYLFYPGTFSKVVALFSVVLNKPIGLYVRGEFYNQDKIDRIILKRAKFILTISPSFIVDLKRFCSNVDIIRPMIDIKLNDFNSNRNYRTPEIWNLLFVGRVEERKGIYELLQIAKNLKSKNFSFKLNIVGVGDLFDLINNKIKEIGIQEQVILHGLISNKKKLKQMYDDANAFIFTSHDEGFPRVLYEAMASGLPIFTTFVGGIPGRMIHLENCVEIPVKNASNASEIIIDSLERGEILESISRKAQKSMSNILEILSHEALVIKHINSLSK